MRIKIVTMAVVLALLSALCAGEQRLVRLLTQEALQDTQLVLSLIGEGQIEEAKRKSRDLDRSWDEKAKWLELLVDHSSTDDVRFALSRLIGALESGDAAASLIYAGELEGGIEHVYERQAVTAENLL